MNKVNDVKVTKNEMKMILYLHRDIVVFGINVIYTKSETKNGKKKIKSMFEVVYE